MPGERTRGCFVLVGCGAAKASETVEARDLYTSSYFAVKRQYAEAAVQWAGTTDRRAELSAFDGGYEREDASWQTAHAVVDIEGTEQASLESFEDVDERHLATKQTRLGTCPDG